MLKLRRLCAALCSAIAIGAGKYASADPLPGEAKIFQQMPELQLPANLGGQHGQYGGSLASGTLLPSGPWYSGTLIADDFSDHFGTPILHVRWWGAYTLPEGFGVKRFYIGFDSDVPVSANNAFSHPGISLSQQYVDQGPLAPGSGTFTEKLISPGDSVNPAVFEYDAELKCPFFPTHDTVYWLKIIALPIMDRDGGVRWGWLNRDWTIMDPLAPNAPDVVPGERVAGFVSALDGTQVPVWQFQGGSVSASVTTRFLDQCNALTTQSNFDSLNYSLAAGPSGIAQFSRDMSFELYTGDVPEPPNLFVIAATAAFTSVRRREKAVPNTHVR